MWAAVIQGKNLAAGTAIDQQVLAEHAPAQQPAVGQFPIQSGDIPAILQEHADSPISTQIPGGAYYTPMRSLHVSDAEIRALTAKVASLATISSGNFPGPRAAPAVSGAQAHEVFDEPLPEDGL